LVKPKRLKPYVYDVSLGYEKIITCSGFIIICHYS